MSDFTGNIWSVYVAALTLAGIAGCLLLLWITARKKVVSHGDNTTGHVWDEDLREMNNPMPRWWMGLFVLTIVFGLGYLVLYPGLGKAAGWLGWTQHGEYVTEMREAEDALRPVYERFKGQALPALAGDAVARGIGERLFMNNCAQCHGSDARGGKGFPDLTDGDWLHGGSPEAILETITHGRVGRMPPMAAVVGSPEQVRNLAHYVLSLSGSPHDSLRAGLGKSSFTACAGCHGMNGKGNTTVGAPNLTDAIWLHGWGEQAIVDIVTNGKVNEMPAQEGKLTPAQIQLVAAYVWGLSAGAAAR